MSDRSVPASSVTVRRSYQLSPAQASWLGVGVWILIGLLGLFDQVAKIAGENVGLVYLFFLIVISPSILSHAELRKRVRTTGGSYRLIQAVERPTLTFLAGWTYLLGLVAINGLIVWTFADQLGRLLDKVELQSPDRWMLALLLIVFYTLSNFMIRRPPWKTVVRLTVLLVAGLTLLGAILFGMALLEGERVVSSAAGQGNFFSAVAVLAGTMWVIELIAERQQRSKLLGSVLRGNVSGLLLAAFLGLVGWMVLSTNITLASLAERVLPGTGAMLLLAISALAALILGSASSLIQLRKIQILARDGVLPLQTERPSSQSHVPVRVILVQSFSWILLSALAYVWVDGAAEIALLLGQLAALMFLLLQIGLNASAILLLRRAGSSEATTRQSLFPIIPATGIAIYFLLLFAVPASVRLVGAGWFALGGLAFWLYGRERLRISQLGVTVFQDLRTQADITSEYPVLVPIANPETAAGLVEIGARLSCFGPTCRGIIRRKRAHILERAAMRANQHMQESAAVHGYARRVVAVVGRVSIPHQSWFSELACFRVTRHHVRGNARRLFFGRGRLTPDDVHLRSTGNNGRRNA